MINKTTYPCECHDFNNTFRKNKLEGSLSLNWTKGWYLWRYYWKLIIKHQFNQYLRKWHTYILFPSGTFPIYYINTSMPVFLETIGVIRKNRAVINNCYEIFDNFTDNKELELKRRSVQKVSCSNMDEHVWKIYCLSQKHELTEEKEWYFCNQRARNIS